MKKVCQVYILKDFNMVKMFYFYDLLMLVFDNNF